MATTQTYTRKLRSTEGFTLTRKLRSNEGFTLARKLRSTEGFTLTRKLRSNEGFTLARKLRSTQGFTLAEQLISIIFIGLLCLAVGTGVSVAMNTFGKVNDQTNADQLLMRTIQEVNSELAYSESVERAGGGEVYSYISPSSGIRVTLSSDARGIVMNGENIGGLHTNEVILVPAANDMVPSLDGLHYDNANNTWQYTATISRIGSPSSTLAEQSMTVAKGTA